MSKTLILDKTGNVEDFDFVIAKRNMEHIGMLSNVDPTSVTYKANMNSADELSFTVYKERNGTYETHWDDVIDLRLVYVPSLNEYFQMDVMVDDNNEQGANKQVTCTSLCEAELGQTMLYNVEINTQDDIARDDYVTTKFYDPNNPKGSLLDRVLQKAPHYTIGYVDEHLQGIQRSFSINSTSIYDFLTGDCADQFNCLFKFDSTTRTINVYDLYTFCNNCAHRGDFSDKCPECGSTDLSYYGQDTTIYVDKENLTDDIQLDVDVDSIKNTFHLVAGDDDMTAAVTNINPNGSAYLYYFSNACMQDMSKELQDKIKTYNEEYNSQLQNYEKLTQDIYESTDQILNLQSKMLPKMSDVVSDAATEVQKIETNLTVVAINKLTNNTSIATVNSAIKNLCKTYIKSGYFKVEIPTDEYNQTTAKYYYQGTDASGRKYGTWTGTIRITNYSDEDDTSTTKQMTIKVSDMYEEYLKEKINKEMADVGKESDSKYVDYIGVVAVMHNDLDELKRQLKLYNLAVLRSFYEAVQGALGVMQAEGHGTPGSEFYTKIYVDYFSKGQAVKEEMDTRQHEIEDEQLKLNKLNDQRNTVQDKLNFRKYLGEDLYKEFCAYRREDEYSNENFISDDLDNAQMIKRAEEFIKDAKQEIVKAGEPQYSLSSTLDNLLVMPEFAPLVDHFKLGNWMRFGVDGKVFRLRLTSYTVNFSDLTTIEVEFSNLTQTAYGVSDVKSILQSAQSMATSYSYVSKQASKGDDADETIADMRRNSLDASLYRIKSNDNEEITYDRYGLLSRAYDDIGDGYSDEQLKVTHNIIAFTTNNWNTVKSAIGKQSYTLNGKDYQGYGVNSDFVLSGTIIGGDIYSDNYNSGSRAGSHIDLRNGGFSMGGGKLVYDAGTSKLNIQGDISASTITGSTINNGNGTFVVDSNGSLNAKNATITGSISSSSISGGSISAASISGGSISGTSINNGNGTFYVDGAGNLTAKNATIIGSISGSSISGGTISGSNISGGSVSGSSVSGGSVTGSAISGGSISGSAISGGSITGSTINNGTGTFSVQWDGTLYASKGTIGCFSINPNYLWVGSGESCAAIGSNWASGTDEKFAFYCGADYGVTAKFTVNYSGDVYCHELWVYGDDVQRHYDTSYCHITGIHDNSGTPTILGVWSVLRVTTLRNTAFCPVQASAFSKGSSRVIKTNIKDETQESAKRLLNLRIVSFDYKKQAGGKKNQRGVIAEQANEIMPQAVSMPLNWDENKYDGKSLSIPTVDYTQFVPDMIKMIQIQQKQIDELIEKIDKLQKGEN